MIPRWFVRMRGWKFIELSIVVHCKVIVVSFDPPLSTGTRPNGAPPNLSRHCISSNTARLCLDQAPRTISVVSGVFLGELLHTIIPRSKQKGQISVICNSSPP